jgi:hypothetical protein
MRRFLLTSPAFIASTLLAEGSIITQDDLGYVDGIPQPPPSSAIEVDEKGMPVTDEGEDLLKAALAGDKPPPPIMPIPPATGEDLTGGADPADIPPPADPAGAPPPPPAAETPVSTPAAEPARRRGSN